MIMNEEKIEEAAENYVNSIVNQRDNSDYSQDVKNENAWFDDYDIQSAFQVGANWAIKNQWRDASNDLPYKDKTLVDGRTTRDLLCISDKNEAYIDFMELLKFGGKWHWFRKNIHKCKYWMPIPSLPEKLK